MRIEAEGHLEARTLYSHVGYLSAATQNYANYQWRRDWDAVLPLLAACGVAILMGAVAAVDGAALLARRPALQRARHRAERRLVYGLLVLGIGLSTWIAAVAWVGPVPWK